jgi:hypothetical protein
VEDESIETLCTSPSDDFFHQKLGDSAPAPFGFSENIDDETLATFSNAEAVFIFVS